MSEFVFDVRCPCSIPWGHTAAELCCPPSCSWSSCHSPPSHSPGWGQLSPQGWGLAVLGFAGAPLLCLCTQCPLLMSPCRCSIPKAPAWGGPFIVVAAPPKSFSHGEHDGIPADTEPRGCVCLCSGGTQVHGGAAGVGEPSFGPRGGCWDAWQGRGVPVTPGLSAGTAEAGEPVREEGLAARPWRHRRLQVGWGQGQGWGQAAGAGYACPWPFQIGDA